jgi:hypothetical protein
LFQRDDQSSALSMLTSCENLENARLSRQCVSVSNPMPRQFWGVDDFEAETEDNKLNEKR